MAHGHSQLDRLARLAPRSLTVLFDLTNKCNLRCRFCYFSYDSVFHRPAHHMAPADFERMAAQVLPYAHTVYLSAGSESLVHPEFLRLLEICSRHGPFRTVLLTNGLLLTDEAIDGLIEFGLSELHVSIDGATPATYEHLRRGASFETLLAKLRALQRRKRSVGSDTPAVQFNVTLMRSNLPELEQFVDLAADVGAERIACRHLMPYAGLGMESEVASVDPLYANRRSLEFLEYSVLEGIDVTSFPDFYSVEDRPWWPSVSSETIGSDAGGPIGRIDAPADASVLRRRSMVLSGWALAPAGIAEVEIAREAGADLVPIGPARFSIATRPDVARRHSDLPRAFRAGWDFELKAEDLPRELGGRARVHAIARDERGQSADLGQRAVVFSEQAEAEPYLFCRKPFDNVYIDSVGNVYPYPDCQTVDPFGSMASDDRFQSIWFGEEFAELRRRIEERDAPQMCLTCPDFINRNVDDPAYVREREVEPALRRPRGFLDAPGPFCLSSAPSIVMRGWALGFSPVVQIEILRASRSGDPPESQRNDGCVVVGTAEPSTEARPDVADAYPALPGCDRAGWSFKLARDHLPGGGPFELRAVAVNRDGNGHVLGTTRVQFLESAP